MDIFEPAGDDAALRPVILAAFGGSFVTGNRSSTHEFCKAFAKKGFVTAAIDYRIYDKPFPPEGEFPDSLDMMEVVIQSVHDYKAAIRYLRKDADKDNLFRIDPDYIFSSGYSAGSVSSLHLAYLDEDEAPEFLNAVLDSLGGLEGNTDDPEAPNMNYSSEVQGVINYYGALHKKEFMDENDPPLISIHGDMDPTVPYGYGFAVVVILPIITVEGSGVLHPYAESLGIMNELITVEGGGHGNFSMEEYLEMEIKSSLFLEKIMCQNTTAINQNKDRREMIAYPNPAAEQILIRFDDFVPEYNYSLIAMDGKEVLRKSNCSDNEFMISRHETGSGIFILNIEFNSPNILPINRKILFGN